MQFVIILATQKRIERVEADAAKLTDVYERAGLEVGAVDHGVLAARWEDQPGIAYVVHQFGMFVPPAEQVYFALGSRLFAGNAVLYGFDAVGDTVDVPAMDHLRPSWFANGYEVEAAIRAGLIERPVIKLNDEIIWRWPERAPEGMGP